MRKITDIDPDEIEVLQQRERQLLETLTDPKKAAQIERLLMTCNWDALKPAFEAIVHPRQRLQATAHACRMAELPGTIMDSKLGAIAAAALWAYQRELTPLGERLAVILCIDILKDNDRLAAPPVEKAIAENLIGRLSANRTSDPMNMTRATKAETRRLLRVYFKDRNSGFKDRPKLLKLMQESREEEPVSNPPMRPGAPSNVVQLFGKPKA